MARPANPVNHRGDAMGAGDGVCSGVGSRVAAGISRAETFLEQRQDELLEFTAELIRTPSHNPPGDQSQVAEIVCSRLNELGAAEAAVVTAAPGRHNVLASVTEDGEAPVLVLNGHLDTKPPGDLAAWNTPPYEPTRQNGSLIGLGTADMKGAVAAITYAAGAVAAARPAGTLRVVFTADEETGGAYGSKWLAEQGLLHGDACVIAEPCGVHTEWEAIRVVSRGVAIFRLTVLGTEMHSSLTDELGGVNASLKMAQLMTRMASASSELLHFTPHPLADHGPTFNVGLLVEAGLGYGVCPPVATFLSDVRALPGMTAESIEADVRGFIAEMQRNDPQLQFDLEMVNWTPPAEIDGSHPIVRALHDAAEAVLGASVPLGVFPGGTDAPYFSGVAGIPTVPAFGPGLLPYAHAPNEQISTSSVLEAARIYALAALEFLNA
jgi:acetylornithine deacetylase